MATAAARVRPVMADQGLVGLDDGVGGGPDTGAKLVTTLSTSTIECSWSAGSIAATAKNPAPAACDQLIGAAPGTGRRAELATGGDDQVGGERRAVAAGRFDPVDVATVRAGSAVGHRELEEHPLGARSRNR